MHAMQPMRPWCTHVTSGHGLKRPQLPPTPHAHPLHFFAQIIVHVRLPPILPPFSGRGAYPSAAPPRAPRHRIPALPGVNSCGGADPTRCEFVWRYRPYGVHLCVYGRMGMSGGFTLAVHDVRWPKFQPALCLNRSHYFSSLPPYPSPVLLLPQCTTHVEPTGRIVTISENLQVGDAVREGGGGIVTFSESLQVGEWAMGI